MRLFVALEISEEVRENLAAIRKKLSFGTEVRWVPPQNFHVTLEFIGNVLAEKVPQIIEALQRVRADGPVKLRFRGMGGSAAGVIWVAIESTPAIESLANDINHRLQPLDIASEHRTFHPHVTVARFKDRKLMRKIEELIEGNRKDGAGPGLKPDFGTMMTSEFHLIESKTLPSGPIYSKVQSFTFVACGK